MKTLIQISELSARIMMQQSPEKFKEKIIETFGNILSMNITERIQTFDDILSMTGEKEEDFISDKDDPGDIAFKKAKRITMCYNAGAVFNWFDQKQLKYQAVFTEKSAGSGLSYYDCAYWLTYPCVGSCLCFADSNHLVDAHKKFPDIFNVLFNHVPSLKL